MRAPGTSPTGRPELRVLALAPYPDTVPSTRYRLVQLAPALAEHGIALTISSFVSVEEHRRLRGGGGRVATARTVLSAFRRVRALLAEVARYDVVLVQRGIGLLGDRGLLDRLLRAGVPVVYDFDDAVYLPQEGGRRWLESLRDPGGTTRAFCRAARIVLAGNEHLASFARSAVGPGDGGRVRVLPSVVDTDRFVPGEGKGAVPAVGWIGSDSTVPYLEALAPALRELLGRVAHRLVVVAGVRRPHLPGVSYDFVTWHPHAEVSRFQELDVGLYPLEDTPWSRGKCGFKALQYLACGVPCVASPVGVLRDIVRPGETGLLADGPAEWTDACARLLSDGAQRARMGEAGRALVQAGYSVRWAAPRLAAALREAAA
jgi:glycosyltransferase involved in cell wall biosynthesis